MTRRVLTVCECVDACTPRAVNLNGPSNHSSGLFAARQSFTCARLARAVGVDVNDGKMSRFYHDMNTKYQSGIAVVQRLQAGISKAF